MVDTESGTKYSLYLARAVHPPYLEKLGTDNFESRVCWIQAKYTMNV